MKIWFKTPKLTQSYENDNKNNSLPVIFFLLKWPNNLDLMQINKMCTVLLEVIENRNMWENDDPWSE